MILRYRPTVFGLLARVVVLLAGACTSVVPDVAPTSAPLPAATATIAPTATASLTPSATPTVTPTPLPTSTPSPTPRPPHPLQIDVMRARSYPGSDFVFEETLD